MINLPRFLRFLPMLLIGVMHVNEQAIAEPKPAFEDVQAAHAAYINLIGQGRYKEAELAVRQALELTTLYYGKDRKREVETLNSLGYILFKLKRFGEAEGVYRHAITVERKTSQDVSKRLAESYTWLARIPSVQGQHKEALIRYHKALDIMMALHGPDDIKVGDFLTEIARVFQAMGDEKEYTALMNKASAILWAKRAERLPGVADGIEEQAAKHVARKEFDQAEKQYLHALSMRETIEGDLSPYVLPSLHKLVSFYMDQARYADAEGMISRRLAIFEIHGGPSHPAVAGELKNLATILRLQGRLENILPLLQRSLRIMEELDNPNPLHIAETYEKLGKYHQDIEEPEEAASWFEKSLKIRKSRLEPGHPQIAQSLGNLGRVYNALGQYEKAGQYFQQALELTKKAFGPDHKEVAILLANLGVSNVDQGHYARGARQIQEALQLGEKHFGPLDPLTAYGLTSLAEAFRAQDKVADARTAIAQASHIFAERTWLGLNKKSERLANRPVHLRRFDIILEDQAYPEIKDDFFATLQAAHTSNAADAVTQLAARYSLGAENARIVRIRQDLVAELEEVQGKIAQMSGLPAAKRDQAVFESLLAARDKSQNGVDAFHEMLRATVSEDYQEKLRLAPLTIQDAQSFLGAGEALVAMTVEQYGGKDDADIVYMILIRQHDVKIARIQIDNLSGKIGALRRKLNPAKVGGRAGLLEFPVETAHALYRKLFHPFDDMLTDINHLLMVPDGAFSSLPFSVLLTEPVEQKVTDIAQFGDMPWLARRYAVSTLPSVSALRALRLAKDQVTPASKPFIGIGDPLLDDHPGSGGPTRSANVADWLNASDGTEQASMAGLFRGNLAETRAVRALAALPETADELAEMAKLLGADSAALLLRDQAREPAIRKERALQDYRVLAFATHGLVAGELNKDLVEPALVLTPPETASTDDDGLLTATEVSKMILNAQWVILSACNTAAPSGTPGAQGLSGLASAFFYAGAQSLFVSHWPVVSTATVKLTTSMLANLETDPSLGTSEAHRRAMLTLMQDKDEPLFAHPLFWAPFTVVGEGGVLQ